MSEPTSISDPNPDTHAEGGDRRLHHKQTAGARFMETTSSLQNFATSIECRSVSKIFGERWQDVVSAMQSGTADKTSILRDYKCVLAINDVSFSIRKGETFCIMGLSGSGKSTLLRLLNRLIEPTLGEVMIHGRDVRKLTPAKLRHLRAHEMGMVFQNVVLLPNRNVIENVALPLEIQNTPKAERLQIARDALAKVELANWADRHPRELSGGMQQRVGLARALACNPEILLMDEPFSALDPLIRKQLQDEFVQLSRDLGKTTVFITHDLEEAMRVGDRIAIMKDGAFVQVGTAEEIVLNPATDYVRDFVHGISRLNLVTARSVMLPVRTGVDSLRAVPAHADLRSMIDLCLDTGADALRVTREDGAAIGVVTREGLLGAVVGRSGPENGTGLAQIGMRA
jgi:glycine betaine/proline transport system ATP-binding protein